MELPGLFGPEHWILEDVSISWIWWEFWHHIPIHKESELKIVGLYKDKQLSSINNSVKPPNMFDIETIATCCKLDIGWDLIDVPKMIRLANSFPIG